MSTAGTSTGVEPQTVTVTLPRLEDYADDFARLDRMGKAMDLAGKLTPEGFARWMELGEAIRAGAIQENEKAPDAATGEHVA